MIRLLQSLYTGWRVLRRPRWLPVVFIGLGLAACQPEFNWRELQPAQAGYRVQMPAKPSSMTRDILVDGMKLSMTLQRAEAGGTSFAVGSARLPDGDPQTRQRALTAMRAAMVHNLGAKGSDDRWLPIAVIDREGRSVGSETGLRVQAVGAPGQPATSMTMAALFVGRREMIYQVVAIGAAPQAEPVANFIDSFRLLD